MRNEDYNNEQPAAFLGTVSKASTMADGSLRIQIDLMPADAVGAFTAFGSTGSSVALARISNEAALEEGRPKSVNGPYGMYARDLIKSGFFRRPDVWEAVGTDDQYLEWLRDQASAKSGNKDYYDANGESYCVAAHVRRVEHGSGTGIKPKYSAIPLTNEEHQLAHQKGDSALGSEDWWSKERIRYVEAWAQYKLKQTLGYDSWTNVSPEVLLKWAEEHDLTAHLPRSVCLKEYEA